MTEDPRKRVGHVIVCGLGDLGVRIVEQLRIVDVDVVVVDDRPEPRCAADVRAWGYPIIDESPRSAEALWAAGLEGAEAVVVVANKDLEGLEITLLARELRPDVRTVVRLDNVAVGAAVADVTGRGSVLSVASLAAPSIVETCLRNPVHRLDVPGVELVAMSTMADVEKSMTLRDRYRDLVPLAIQDVDAPEPVICPGRDHSLDPGDRVTLIGTPEELAKVGVKARVGNRPEDVSTAAAHVRPRVRLRRFLRSLATGIDGPLRTALIATLMLVVASSVVLSLAYRRDTPSGTAHLGPLQAVYFTLETITTVGFGDFSFGGQARWLVVFGIALIVLGAIVMTTLLALLTNLLVSRRVAASLGQARVTQLRGHVVVIGLGSVGVRVVEGLLAAGREVVVVERSDDNRFAAQIREMGVPMVVGDATLEATLAAAGVPTARAVAVVTSDDLANIESGLAVRGALGERAARVPIVLRVFDRSLGATVEHSFGFRQVQSTADLAAPWFVGAALGLDVLGSFYVEEIPFLLGRLEVAPDGGLAGVAMRDLGARMRVVALERAARGGELEYPPRRSTTFHPGDSAYLVGPYEEITRVLRRERAGG